MWTCSPGCATRRTRGRARRTGRGNGAAARPRRLPRPEVGLDQAPEPPRCRSRRPRRGRRCRGRSSRAWCAWTSSSVSRFDVADRAPRVAGVGMIAVDQVAEEQVGAEGRVVAVALELGGDPAARPGECLGGEGGPPDHVGEDLQGQRQVLGADPERGAGRADVERAADVLDRLGQGLGRAGRASLPRASGRSGRPSPGFASRSTPASTNSSSATMPVPGRRSETSRRPLARTVATGVIVGQLRAARRHRQARSVRSATGGAGGRGRAGARLGRQQDRHRPVRPRQRPADRQAGVGQVGRDDAADVVGLDRQGRAVLGLPGAPVAPGSATWPSPRGQPGEVFLLPAPGGFEPVPRPCQLLGASGRRRRARPGPRRSPRSICAGGIVGAASTWSRNCPARRGPSCAASTQVAIRPCSTRAFQSRDASAAGQQVGQDVERRAVGMAARARCASRTGPAPPIRDRPA